MEYNINFNNALGYYPVLDEIQLNTCSRFYIFIMILFTYGMSRGEGRK